MPARSMEFLPEIEPLSPISTSAWTERGTDKAPSSKSRDSHPPSDSRASSRRLSVSSAGTNRSEATTSQESHGSRRQRRVRKREGRMVTEYYPRKVVWILFIWLLIICAFGLLARPPGRVAYKRKALWAQVERLGLSGWHTVSYTAGKLGIAIYGLVYFLQRWLSSRK